MSVRRIAYLSLFVITILALFFVSEVLWKNYQTKLQAQEELENQQIAEEEAVKTTNSIKDKLRSGDYNNENLKVVFLTFDDGPFEDTGEILDLLAENDVKATFFTNGKTFDDFTPEYQRIVADGHTLANHTYSHEYEIYDSVDTFLADVDKLHNFQTEVTGVEPLKIFRFPGGSSNTSQENIDALVQDGYNYVDWNVQYYDGVSDDVTSDEAYQGIIDGVHKNSVSVVLSHLENPYKDEAREGLSRAIQQLKSEGYTFMTIEPDFKLARFVQPTGSTDPVVPDPALVDQAEQEEVTN